MFKTPILFIIFNRPDVTLAVFNEIKKQQPENLYVFADGPRIGKVDDKLLCEKTRSIIDVDWECNLNLQFCESNLGCGKGPVKAISWFFDNVEEGIIIEDDCLPHPDFFNYCQELLERYRYTDRIMVIGAATYRDDYPCEYSYTFSSYATMAAWATWRRVWKLYDYTLSFLGREELQRKLRILFRTRFEINHWLRLYDWAVQDNFSDYWDWQLSLTVFFYQGLAIRPKHNLICNIGIGLDATHTKDSSSEMFQAFRKTYPISPLTHPLIVESDKKHDSVYFKKMYYKPFSYRFKRLANKYINKILYN